jgi:hypothetical protein
MIDRRGEYLKSGSGKEEPFENQIRSTSIVHPFRTFAPGETAVLRKEDAVVRAGGST